MAAAVIGGGSSIWSGVLAKLTPAERLVLVAMAAHADEQGVAWPSVRRLIEACGYSERVVRSALAELRDHGWIEVVEERFAHNASTIYRLHLPPVAHDMGSPEPPAAHDRDPLLPTAEPPAADSRQKNKEGSLKKNARATSPDDPDFGIFWDLWPRKVSKRAAAKAWTSATKRAAAGQIIDGARRYAAGPLPEARFIPYPTTWLNGDRWNDTPQGTTNEQPDWIDALPTGGALTQESA